MKSTIFINPLKKGTFTLLVAAIVLLASCQEEVLTPGEIAGKKIKEIAKKENILQGNVFLYNQTYQAQSDAYFTVEGGFLVTHSPEATYYDLNKLVSFRAVGDRINFYFQ